MAAERCVVVTGARGLIGSAAVAALAGRGWLVHAVSRQPIETMSDGVRWHAVDLLDAAQRRALMAHLRCPALLHLAWITESPRYWNSPQNLDWVLASLDLLEDFAANGGRRAVCAGTCAEYDWANEVFVEDRSPLAPATVYGRAKASLFWLASDLARAKGVSLAWGRVFFTFGPFESAVRLVPAVVRGLLEGETVPVTSCTQLRDILYSKDLGDAFAHLVDCDIEGAVNVSSGQGVPLHALVDAIAAAAGRSDLVRYGALPRRPNEPECLVGDNARLRSTGWQPKWSLDAAARDTVDWWRARAHV